MAALFRTVLNMSGTGAVVICAVLLLRLALRSAPKRYSYWLWAAAGFRLLCPVSWKSALSIFALLPAAGVRVPATDVGAAGSAIRYLPEPGLTQLPDGVRIVPGWGAAQLPPAQAVQVDPAQRLLFIAALVWLIGAAAMLIWGAVSYVRLSRRLRTAVIRWEGVWESDAVDSPFILGFFWPKIYIPFGLEGERLDYVLAHECFHIGRCDHLVKALAFFVLTLHWFNPLVWLAFHLMGRDMEMRCDEHVLGRSAAERKQYSETLLSFAAAERFPGPGPLAFGESDVRARIKNALRWKKPALWVTVLAVLAAAVGIAACSANPREPAPEPAPPAEAAATQTPAPEVTPTPLPQPDGTPETMLAAVGIDGTRGYVRRSDVEGELPSDPAEAAAYMRRLRDEIALARSKGQDYLRLIPLYAADGVTQIGQFAVSLPQETQVWAAEVDMIGEQFVSKAGAAGNWWDIPAAFADLWCEKYADASADSPFACYQSGVWELGNYLNAVSLTGAPRRLAFNVTLTLSPRDEKAFIDARAGWAEKAPDGRLLISTEAVLVSDDDVHWTVEAMNSGGSGGWGYRRLPGADDHTQETLSYILSSLRQGSYGAELHLLLFAPNLDWERLSEEEFHAAVEGLRAAAVKTEDLDFGESDQLYRDLYMLWGAKNTDGAYAELFLDGPESLLGIQYRADPETFERALAEMDARMQETVRRASKEWTLTAEEWARTTM